MRYKVIDNKRLNVYLTKKDLLKENVTIEDIVDGNTKSVIKIKKIFKVVSKLAHFNVNGRLLNIVLFPVIDGDLIISAGIFEGDNRKIEKEMFTFENFEDLLCACLNVKRYNVLSSLYLFEGKYCLAVQSENEFEDLCSLLSEFGEKTNCNILFVTEHGKSIIKNFAVEKLTKMFD